MEWEDERIIYLRNEERKKSYSNLRTGMYVKEQLVKFEASFMDALDISLVLPLGFKVMNEEEINRKYPSVDRPDAVVGNEAGDVAFALSKLSDHIPDDELRKNTIGVLKTLVSSSNPSIVLLNEGAVENEGMSCNWFDFKSYTITGSIYNLSGIVSFDKRTVLAMFSCPYELNPWWIPVFLKILETFEEQAGKGGENEGQSYYQ